MNLVVLKPPGFRKLSHSSEMQNDALMHCEGLKGEEVLIIDNISLTFFINHSHTLVYKYILFLIITSSYHTTTSMFRLIQIYKKYIT